MATGTTSGSSWASPSSSPAELGAPRPPLGNERAGESVSRGRHQREGTTIAKKGQHPPRRPPPSGWVCAQYEAELFRLQVELVALQEWVRATGTRVVSSSRDRTRPARAARSSASREYLSPRVARIEALPVPTERERVLVLGLRRRAAPPVPSRLHDPVRRWKLSPMDLQSIEPWEDYSRANVPDHVGSLLSGSANPD